MIGQQYLQKLDITIVYFDIQIQWSLPKLEFLIKLVLDDRRSDESPSHVWYTCINYPDFNPKGDQTQNSTIFLTFTLFRHWKIMKNIYCNLKILHYYLLHANLYLNGQTSFIPPPTQKLKTPLTPSLTMGVKGLISSKNVSQCISHGLWPDGITARRSLLCHLLCLHKPALFGLGDGSGRGKGNRSST